MTTRSPPAIHGTGGQQVIMPPTAGRVNVIGRDIPPVSARMRGKRAGYKKSVFDGGDSPRSRGGAEMLSCDMGILPMQVMFG
jgi:hypothetical protein